MSKPRSMPAHRTSAPAPAASDPASPSGSLPRPARSAAPSPFIALADGTVAGNEVRVPYDKNYRGKRADSLSTDDAMTGSQEQLKVDTEKVQTGTARLREFVVTEQQSVPLPVTREEVRVVREPITEADLGKAMDGLAISEAEHEIVLTEERIVVSKETVPVKRIRMESKTITENHDVTESVRKGQIESDTATHP